jgi:1,2-diacylglycerol-3-alpha-glucose alpha-1,2-galactosyltransferase
MKGEGVNTAFLNCVELLKEQKDVEVFINNEGIGDIMHSHTYGPYYFWRGLKYKGRRILSVHVIPDSIKGSIPGSKLFMPFVRWYFKKVFSYADICIAISPMVEKTITDLGASTTIARLNNSIQIDNWKRTPELRKKGREILGLNENDFCVLGVGQLENRKGCDDFIEIGKQVSNAQFRWIGGRPFGMMTEGILKLNHKITNAPGNIKFPGLFPLSEMSCLYAAGDLFLFPSYQENCPLAPIEAAASGMPVIYRNIHEYKLLYKNEYLNADTNEQFVSYIKRIMYDKEEYKRGLAISNRLITQFDKDEIRLKLIELYKGLSSHTTQQPYVYQ